MAHQRSPAPRRLRTPPLIIFHHRLKFVGAEPGIFRSVRQLGTGNAGRDTSNRCRIARVVQMVSQGSR